VCPHCGEFEDSVHIWKCSLSAVSDVWQTSLYKLQTSLRKLDTDPDLIDVIMQYLNSWRHDTHLQPLDDEKYSTLLDLQNKIGARQFFEGWLHWEWESIQEQFYHEIKSR
jgi:hypothetical protein